MRIEKTDTFIEHDIIVDGTKRGNNLWIEKKL